MNYKKVTFYGNEMQKKVGGCKRKTISEGNKEEGKKERKIDR